MSFDSLTFARRLKAAGFTEAQAEALADANREMVVHDTATKDDLADVKTELKTDIAAVRAELAAVKTELKGDIAAVKAELKTDIAAVKIEIISVEQRLMSVIENQTLRLTVRMGIMLAGGLSLMTAIIGALMKFH